jgi:hypothetical protein
VLRYLTDRPEEAEWLPEDERAWLSARMQEERAQRARSPHQLTLRSVFASGAVWHFAFLYFTIVIGFYGIAFWLPQIVRSMSGLTDLQVGLVSAIPYVAAAAAMVRVAAHSDRTGERRVARGRPRPRGRGRIPAGRERALAAPRPSRPLPGRDRDLGHPRRLLGHADLVPPRRGGGGRDRARQLGRERRRVRGPLRSGLDARGDRRLP